MNGIVSQNMRAQGADYKINFGLTLPLLKRIAQEVGTDAQLADALWSDTAVRESMMLAPMIYPVEKFDEQLAEKWLAEMPNTEVADICCKYLFCRLPFAPQKVLDWTGSCTTLHRYTGTQLATAWRIAHKCLENKALFKQIADMAVKNVYESNRNLAFASITFLKQAVHDNEFSEHILPKLKALSVSDNQYKNLFDELTQERNLFIEFAGNDSN